jgi:hypothetical protein
MISEHFKSQSRRIVSAADRRKLEISNVLIRSYSIIKHIYGPLEPFRNAFQKFKSTSIGIRSYPHPLCPTRLLAALALLLAG